MVLFFTLFIILHFLFYSFHKDTKQHIFFQQIISILEHQISILEWFLKDHDLSNDGKNSTLPLQEQIA